jgi:simple sugar transport system permease protein
MFNLKLSIQEREINELGISSSIISPIIAIIATMFISTILLLVLGYEPLSVFYEFFISPLISAYQFGEVVMKASILIIIALGLSVGFRAGVWNIGAEGQFIFGGIFGSIIALYFNEQSGVFVIPLMMIAGIIGGILWALIPALLKNYFDVNEILTSLMLVYVAQLFLGYLVHGPLKDPDGFNFPQSAYFSDSAIYPILIEGTKLSITPLILIAIFPLMYLFLNKSYIGFALKIRGYSSIVSTFAGFSSKKILLISFIICGGLTGFAGISEVSSNISQLVPSISPGYGFSAIIVAFLGRLHPVGIIFSGFLMALIYIGAESAQISLGLPVSIGGIFQGLILFSLLGTDFFVVHKIKLIKDK